MLFMVGALHVFVVMMLGIGNFILRMCYRNNQISVPAYHFPRRQLNISLMLRLLVVLLHDKFRLVHRLIKVQGQTVEVFQLSLETIFVFKDVQ